MEALNVRIVLLCDNSLVALLLSTVFNSFVQVSENRYNRFEMVSVQRGCSDMGLYLRFC